MHYHYNLMDAKEHFCNGTDLDEVFIYCDFIHI